MKLKLQRNWLWLDQVFPTKILCSALQLKILSCPVHDAITAAIQQVNQDRPQSANGSGDGERSDKEGGKEIHGRVYLRGRISAVNVRRHQTAVLGVPILSNRIGGSGAWRLLDRVLHSCGRVGS